MWENTDYFISSIEKILCGIICLNVALQISKMGQSSSPKYLYLATINITNLGLLRLM